MKLNRPAAARRSRRFPFVGVRLVALLSLALFLAAVSLSCTTQERIEFGLAQGVNQIRSESGLPPLIDDPQLAVVARARAQDMVDNGYFGHIPPDGCALRCLFGRYGIAVGWSGEVIAWNNAPLDQAAAMATGQWGGSAEHIAVITKPCFTRMGVGAAAGGDGRVYSVAVFEGNAPGC